MTIPFPWRPDTTPPIAAEDDSRYETPGGAANKIEQALEDAKEYTDAELLSYVAQTLNLADDSVTRPKIAPGAVGATEIDPSLLDYTTDIAVAAKFNEVDAQLADIANVENYELNSKKREKSAVVTFITDDGNQTDISRFKPIFDAEGVPCVSAIIPTRVGTIGHMTLANLKMLEAAGWEMASHTYTHEHLAELSDQDSENEIKLAMDWFAANGLRVESLCYPYGSWSDREKVYTRRYNRSARTSDRGINVAPIETYQLKSVVLGEETGIEPESGLEKNSLEYYKYWVDKAFANNGWLIFLTHSWAMDPTQLDFMQETIQYIKSKSMDIITMNQALNRYGNIVDVGNFNKNSVESQHFVIGSDGSISSAGSNTIYTGYNTYTATDTIDKFENSKISITEIRTSGAATFPEAKAGTLYTYKMSVDDYFGYQEYKIAQKNSKYIRYARVDKTWTAWEYENAHIVLSQNSVNNASLSTDFPDDTISVVNVGTSFASGLPENKAGTLTTYKLGTDKGFFKQEYSVYASNNKYIRYCNSGDGTWQPWIKITTSVITAQNAFLASSAYTAFENEKITYTKVTNASASGFPETKGGMLITHRLAELGYVFQEYHIYGSWNVYKRYVDEAGSWSAWKSFTMA
jgi:peptidoglycan/xylan/chitin deacetylase (PgdA/CDA1 family)